MARHKGYTLEFGRYFVDVKNGDRIVCRERDLADARNTVDWIIGHLPAEWPPEVAAKICPVFRSEFATGAA